MFPELSSLAAAVEVQRATAAFWAEGTEPDPEIGVIRRAARAAGRAVGSLAGWLHVGQRTGAQTGTVPGGA